MLRGVIWHLFWRFEPKCKTSEIKPLLEDPFLEIAFPYCFHPLLKGGKIWVFHGIIYSIRVVQLQLFRIRVHITVFRQLPQNRTTFLVVLLSFNTQTVLAIRFTCVLTRNFKILSCTKNMFTVDWKQKQKVIFLFLLGTWHCVWFLTNYFKFQDLMVTWY